jgi:glycosyltransferase involved in cell wall biosynthesis
VKVLGFCEGARPDAGGIGIICVPQIHRALSGRGHRNALIVAGQAMPSAQPLLRETIGEIFDSSDQADTGVVPVPAYGRWYLAPTLYRTVSPWVAKADFLTMHSVFSYPVLIGHLLALRFNKPYAVWPHGVFAPVQRQVSSFKKAIYNKAFARRILESASILVYTAEGEREEARALGLRTPSVIIPHGIDVTPFERASSSGAFRSKYLGGHRGPVVLYLGRLNIKKGLDLLVASISQVVREVPGSKLVIAGGGHPPEFADKVRRWISDAGVQDACVMTGVLDEENKAAALGDCDVFVLPSAAENFGVSLFEAMASRCAVVCSETVNYADEVRRHDAGIVVPRTVEALSRAIVTLLRDGNRRRVMGDNAWELASDYSWDACGRRVEVAIQAVLMHEPFPASLQPA